MLPLPTQLMDNRPSFQVKFVLVATDPAEGDTGGESEQRAPGRDRWWRGEKKQDGGQSGLADHCVASSQYSGPIMRIPLDTGA